jgi:hypothetical protein
MAQVKEFQNHTEQFVPASCTLNSTSNAEHQHKRS